ncbi:MAG: hypothetical protein IJ354_01210 [Clostridia bacterium]|nr:hypothetical protein [Clostridia bacterium]
MSTVKSPFIDAAVMTITEDAPNHKKGSVRIMVFSRRTGGMSKECLFIWFDAGKELIFVSLQPYNGERLMQPE